MPENKQEINEEQDVKPKKRKFSIARMAVIHLTIGLVMIVVCYFGKAAFEISPFKNMYEFEAPTNVFSGVNGYTYVIDGGKKEVVVIDENKSLKRIITVGDENNGYYYASLICDDEKGNIYICDVVYSGIGTKLANERILKYDKYARDYTVIMEIDYSQSEKPPMQYGNILSMSVSGDTLTYTINTEEGIDVNSLDLTTKQVSKILSCETSDTLVAAEYDTTSGTAAFSTRLGDVYRVNADGTQSLLVDGDGVSIPWKLTIYDGKVYCADISDGALKYVALDTKEISEWTKLHEFDGLSTVSIVNGYFTGTNCVGIYCGGSSVDNSYFESVRIANYPLRLSVWICAALGIISGLAVAIIVAESLIRKNENETIRRVLLVLVVSILISALVSYIILSRMLTTQNTSTMKGLNTFCDVMVESTDVNNLMKIDCIEEYKGSAYNELKDKLDNLTDKSYENEMYFYYAIYGTDGETIYCIMDYEDTVTSHHPVYKYGEPMYTDVFEKGETIQVSNNVSSYGSWAFVLGPIYDDNGNIVALMEAGTSIDRILDEQHKLIFEIVVTVLSLVIVIVMLMLELIFYMSFSERKRHSEELDITQKIPLRTLIFITYLADSMQDSFITILSSRMFDDSSVIPREIGITLPLSAQVLMIALFAFLGGKIINVFGKKQTLIVGIIIEILGFIICGAAGSYWGILVGKTLFGIGMGLVIVTINTVAAIGKGKMASATAFADINAGILAGVTAGAGVGSVIISVADYRSVYFTAATILFVSALIAISTPDYKKSEIVKKNIPDKKINVFSFIFKKEILAFAVLVLIPFMISLSFREVFFPLYSEAKGISEAWIGRIFLVCGLLVIYLGPMLTKLLIETLGNKWTVVLSSALMCFMMILFVLIPKIEIAIAGMVILSIAISFGYAAQSTYYSSLKSVKKFGEGKAMGVYSLFESTGQTLGPVVFSVIIASMGGVLGNALIGCSMVILLLVFVLASSIGKLKQNKKDKREE